MPRHLSPVLVASHPRSGTHLAIDFIRRNFASTRTWRLPGQANDHLYLNLERLTAHQRRFPERLARRILNRPRRAIIKTHYLADFSETWIEAETGQLADQWQRVVAEANVIYVSRHPAEVFTSYKLFLSALNPEIAKMSFKEFISGPHWSKRVSRLVWWQEHVHGWLDQPDVFHLRYQDIVRSPQHVLDKLHAGLDEEPLGVKQLLPPRLPSRKAARWQRLSRLSPDTTSILGPTGHSEVEKLLSRPEQSDLAWIRSTVGDTMERLGYCRDPDPSPSP